MQFNHNACTLWIAVLFLLLVNAGTQSFPQRPNIAGAVPVPIGSTRPQFRNEKLIRVRRPITLRSQNTYVPSVTPRLIEEPKPVTEITEDDHPGAFLPQMLREQQLAQAQQAQFLQTAAAFLSGESNSIQDTPSVSHLAYQDEESSTPTAPALSRFPERERTVQASATTSPTPRPTFNDYGISSNFGSNVAQRFGLERAQPGPAPTPLQPQRVNVIRGSRPNIREPLSSTLLAQAVSTPSIVQSVRTRPKATQTQPTSKSIINQSRRPVAQTIRKWREENEDGSITWGYENDDGSFKEELIGVDCITKGTYGYVDPDGNKREYHYETGIKCDPNTRETEEELQQNGFINYEENKAILPNGIEIDMSQIGKNKSKRPLIYRN